MTIIISDHLSHTFLAIGFAQTTHEKCGGLEYVFSYDLHLVVDGNSIWPTDATVDQDQPLGPVQAGALDTWVLAPLSPEQIPAHKRLLKHAFKNKHKTAYQSF